MKTFSTYYRNAYEFVKAETKLREYLIYQHVLSALHYDHDDYITVDACTNSYEQLQADWHIKDKCRWAFNEFSHEVGKDMIYRFTSDSVPPVVVDATMSKGETVTLGSIARAVRASLGHDVTFKNTVKRYSAPNYTYINKTGTMYSYVPSVSE